jgi:hypothetical protein
LSEESPQLFDDPISLVAAASSTDTEFGCDFGSREGETPESCDDNHANQVQASRADEESLILMAMPEASN